MDRPQVERSRGASENTVAAVFRASDSAFLQDHDPEWRRARTKKYFLYGVVTMIFHGIVFISGVLIAFNTTKNVALLVPASLLVGLAAFVEAHAATGTAAGTAGAVWTAWLTTVCLQLGFIAGAVARDITSRRHPGRLRAHSTGVQEGSGS